MAKSKTEKVFKTDKRIRLGLWGLGRGLCFFRTAEMLNMDVVAGCDYNVHMQEDFLRHCPGAFATGDIEEFLKQDIDAVVVATFCPAHADDVIKCLKAGKHVLSEVTAFHTLAEGVRLVDEVEKSGLVYNLAENYPFTAANMWLANRWREGLFGELMYAEYEYVHEIRSLSYTYIDGKPVQPGHTPHNWRSWLSFHYYCTHSLGPMMVITGTRPVRVESLPSKVGLAGYLKTPINGLSLNGPCPSLITMSNGAVVRNLMGAMSNDSHQQRLWGTLGAAEMGHDGMRLRLGASGGSPINKVTPVWEGLGELAAKTGHGGGDFWTLYYFAREILTGEKGPFDIYGAADVTIPGILALRSSLEGGKPYDVPDFRIKAERDKCRNDNWAQDRYDTAKGVFGGAKLDANASRFTTIMKELIECSLAYRAYADWSKVEGAMQSPGAFLKIAEKLYGLYSRLTECYKLARAIVKAYPKTDGARVLSEMLEVGEEKKALAPEFLPALKKRLAALRRKFPELRSELLKPQVSGLLPLGKGIQDASYPKKGIKFTEAVFNSSGNFFDVRNAHDASKPGLVYIKGIHEQSKAGGGMLSFGADGPVKVFVNGIEVACKPKATNPIINAEFSAQVCWKKGKNEVVFALDINKGNAWGVSYGNRS